MDRGKLNKAAVQNKHNQAWTKHTHTTSFKNGANWLMQQPLSERLTEDEKEKIREYYNQARELMRFGRNPEDLEVGQSYIIVFNKIFGADLFKEK